MDLVKEMLQSPWFWIDVILSISGGVIVWWGLKVERDAETLIPPDSFKPDIFNDIIIMGFDRSQPRGHKTGFSTV
jgi:hypothetical protein